MQDSGFENLLKDRKNKKRKVLRKKGVLKRKRKVGGENMLE